MMQEQQQQQQQQQQQLLLPPPLELQLLPGDPPHQRLTPRNNLNRNLLPVIEKTDIAGTTVILDSHTQEPTVIKNNNSFSSVESQVNNTEDVESNVDFNDNDSSESTKSNKDYILGTKKEWPWGMSNFHFSLCVGCICFCIFWLILLLRIYLPDEYWFSEEALEKRRLEREQRGD